MASVLGLAETLTYKATVMVPISGREVGIGKMLGRPKLMQNAGYRDSHSWKSNPYGYECISMGAPRSASLPLCLVPKRNITGSDDQSEFGGREPIGDDC